MSPSGGRSVNTRTINLICRIPTVLGVGLLLIFTAECRPPNQSMFVAYVWGDVFLPDLRSGTWNLDEIQECEIDSRGSIRPDEGRDLLLCGEKTQLAWSQTWLRGDIRIQIYAVAKKFDIIFRSAGHSGRSRGSSPRWQCKKTTAGLDCE
jgi:hypothetical protein